MRAFIGLLLAIGIATSAAAQGGDAHWEACRTHDDIAADARIAACAATIAKMRANDPNLATAYYNRGSAWRDKGELDRAIADYGEAIRREPDHPDAYNNRGIAHRIKGYLPEAIADYDQALRLHPNDTGTWFDRGTARFELGRFTDAAADFAETLKHEAADPYAVLWHHMARARAGRADAKELAAAATRIDRTSWPGPLIALFLGETDQDQVHAAAAKGDAEAQDEQRCEVAFYLGEYELLRGDKPRARRLLQAAADICAKNSYEHGAAAAELKRLGR